MESPLEAVWAAELYSTKPNNSSSYSPITDMSSCSISVSGQNGNCANLGETARAFYQKFYRYDIDHDGASYSDVVTEERGGQ